jgi:hypothetical protein
VILQSREYQDLPLFENFLPGVQQPPPTVDDNVAPSSLDMAKNEGSEVTGYGTGGGVY